jgi:glycosyltransferase involved in cell wall biosynthesis
MHAQGPVSSALGAYLQAHQHRFGTIGFFGYLYATSYLLLPSVEKKAVLWPFAHDEWPLHLSMWDRFFARPRRLITSSVEESALLSRRFPELEVPRTLVGVGVAQPAGVDADRFRERYRINGPFMLYLGRVDPSKGCDTLFDYARKYCGGDSRIRSLVLIGDAQMPIPDDPRIISLGRVDENVKWDALAAAQAVVMPSPYESLSLAVLEAWASGKPVVVNAASPVLVGQCRRANGGVWYATYDEFAAALDLLANDLGHRLGEQGRAYTSRHYLWDEAVASYQEILAS